MAVFASTTDVNGVALDKLIGSDKLSEKDWNDLKQRVIQGGKHIIDLRGRSSFQSPAYPFYRNDCGSYGRNTVPLGLPECMYHQENLIIL